MLSGSKVIKKSSPGGGVNTPPKNARRVKDSTVSPEKIQ